MNAIYPLIFSVSHKNSQSKLACKIAFSRTFAFATQFNSYVKENDFVTERVIISQEAVLKEMELKHLCEMLFMERLISDEKESDLRKATRELTKEQQQERLFELKVCISNFYLNKKHCLKGLRFCLKSWHHRRRFLSLSQPKKELLIEFLKE